MIISLVNPHDVLFYPKTYVWLPATTVLAGRRHRAAGDGAGEPFHQTDGPEEFLELSNASGLIPTRIRRSCNYLNFYGNLMMSSDTYLVQVLDTLEKQRPAREHADHPHRRPW